MMREKMMKRVRTLFCMLLAVTLLLPTTYTQAAASNAKAKDASLFDLNSYGYVTSTTPDTTAETTDKTFQEIADEKAQALISIYGVTSVQIAIMQNDEMILSKSYGYNDIKTKTVPTTDTLYGIGSVSKMFTTAAVMQLVEQGKVELDKPVVTYIPEFKMADSRYKDITVRMLLNHSSGILGSSMSNCILLGEASQECHDNFLKCLSTQYLKYKPGSSSVYCNDGFSLAEILVEKVSGVSFTAYIDKEISTPLGLSNTKTPMSSFDTSRLAKTYFTPVSATPYEAVNIIGAGGIYSTAEDLCKFGTAFMNNSNSLLSAQSKTAMGKPEYKNGFWTSEECGSIAYGLGWDSMKYSPYSDYGVTAYNKGGDTIFYHAAMTVLPEKNITVAVLTSGGSSTCNALYGDSVLTAYMEEKNMIHIKEKETKKYETTDLPENAKDYSGIYMSAIGPKVTVTMKEDNTLNVNISGSDIPVQYTTDGHFVNKEQTIWLKFVSHNNTMYIEYGATSVMPSLGSVDTVVFLGQKLTANPIHANVKKAWKQRENKKYYLVNEKPSSYYYLLGLDSMCGTFSLSTDIEGYLSGMKIINKNLCCCSLEVPVMYGRDAGQINVFKKNGIEYLSSQGNILMSEDGLKTLPNQSNMTLTLPSTGYNMYYKISSKTANKKATITVPKNASFVVYAKDGSIVTNYYLSKKKTVTLPKGGTLLLIGDKNAKFSIKLK